MWITPVRDAEEEDQPTGRRIMWGNMYTGKWAREIAKDVRTFFGANPP
jgi:hypothetical protein